MLELFQVNIIGLLFLFVAKLMLGTGVMRDEPLMKKEILQISFIIVCVISIFINTEYFLLPAITMIILEISLFIKRYEMKTVKVNLLTKMYKRREM